MVGLKGVVVRWRKRGEEVIIESHASKIEKEIYTKGLCSACCDVL